jgi:uncharacterized protein (TIGR02145 family)
VPTDAEINVLTDYLGGISVAGGKLKSLRTHPDPHPRWDIPNGDATNESNWSALPGGCRPYAFTQIGTYGYWWSSTQYNTTEAFHRLLYYSMGLVDYGYTNKTWGLSVRCLKD